MRGREEEEVATGDKTIGKGHGHIGGGWLQ